MGESMRELYPEIETLEVGHLKVSDVHSIYYETSGNPNGVPVVFIHGGPGGGTSPKGRRYFDPKHYKIIQFDQRGCGKSTPHADLTENNTWKLVEDMECLRQKLGLAKWHVFGGSWGSTLALAYAQTHPEQVISLCLRGIFLCRPKELRWFYQEGANKIWPDNWEPYRDFIPENERNDMMAAYYRRLTSDDKNTRLEAAIRWSVWEGASSRLIPGGEGAHEFDDPEFALAFARIECHYFNNKAFFKTDNWLIENIDKIRHIPCQIVQGRYDIVCPIESAWELHRAWPESQLHIIPDAGHSSNEDGIRDRLVRIMDDFRELG